MISRRLLRIKVLQTLYAYNAFYDVETESDLRRARHELQRSIDRSYTLYQLVFLLLIDLQKFADNYNNELKEKRLAVNRVENPNQRFVNNRVIAQLLNTKALMDSTLTWNEAPLNLNSTETKAQKKQAEEIETSDNQKLVADLFRTMIETDAYKAYMNGSEDSYDADRKFIIGLLKSLENNESLYELLEERSVYWNDDIEFVLSMNIQTLERTKESATEIKLMKLYKNKDDEEFATTLLDETIQHHSQNLETIRGVLRNWDWERLTNIDKNILEMALSEITVFESIPVNVSMNEYIDLAKFYSTENSSAFINGILDIMVKKLKSENRIHKTGRGLIEKNLK